MAGFYPHLGFTGSYTSWGAYASLSCTATSGILDSICADISASGGLVNGWSLYDDMRNMPFASCPSHIVWSGGFYNLSQYGSGYTWTWVSASAYITSTANYGYASAFTAPVYDGDAAPMWLSPDNVNWYLGKYYTWGGYQSTTQQDRIVLTAPYSGTTVAARFMYTKIPNSIVLKCHSTSSTDFYVYLGLPASGNSPQYLYARVYESWNSGTHVGYNGSDVTVMRNHQYGLPTGSLMRYMLFLYPDVFGLWISRYGAPGHNSFFYAGNLDTSEPGAVSADKYALWVGSNDNSYAGYNMHYGQPWQTQNVFWGNSQCLRSANGADLWNFGYYSSGQNVCDLRKSHMYQTWPRGRFWGENPYVYTVDWYGKINLLNIDVFQAGWSDNAVAHTGPNGGHITATEQFRGKIRYLKTFASNPSGMNLTTHPASDGNTYVCFKVAYAYTGAGNTNRYSRDINNNQANCSNFTGKSLIQGSLGDHLITPVGSTPAYNQNMLMRHFAMAVL